MTITTPAGWRAWLDGPAGLVVGLACLVGWFYGILPKTWWTRSGWYRALQYLAASIRRHPGLPGRLSLLAAGCAGIWLVWWGGGARWQALLTALVGAAFSGGMIWLVRVVAGGVLGREAMGFGDVTLMATIGAFLGWQASLLVFFMAPFTALVVAVAQWLITRRKDIAYGPYLCLSAVLLIVCCAPSGSAGATCSGSVGSCPSCCWSA